MDLRRCKAVLGGHSSGTTSLNGMFEPEGLEAEMAVHKIL